MAFSHAPRLSTNSRYGLPATNSPPVSTGWDSSGSPLKRAPSRGNSPKRHARSGSISDKIGKMRARAGSASAGEIVEALKAPVSVKLVVSEDLQRLLSSPFVFQIIFHSNLKLAALTDYDVFRRCYV